MTGAPIFRLTYPKEYREAYYQACEKIFDRAFLTNDEFVLQFQNDFAHWTGAKHSIAVSNGTAALEALLRAVDVRDKEVILPTNTFMASAVAVINAGGRPVLADIEPDFASISPAHVESLITQNTAAVITVHIGGLISPSVKDLVELCKVKNIALVEDCAHAHGSSLEGTHAGRFGMGGSFSFFTTKVLTMGEGGAIITDSTNVQEKIISIRQFGKTAEDPSLHYRDGNNLKLTEFQAALGSIELKYAKAKISRRQEIAKTYMERLDPTWRPLKPSENSECSFYKQILWPKTVERAQLQKFLTKHQIALTGGVYNTPLHRQPIFANDYKDHLFPVANHFATHHICPPCYPDLAEEELLSVCRAFEAFLEGTELSPNL